MPLQKIPRTFFLIASLLFISASCSPSKTKLADSKNNSLSYEVIGEGEPALVFIHCWSCNKDYWKNQVESFSKRHKLVLLDLPGHGESRGVLLPEWNVKALAKSVEDIIGKLRLKYVILVGSSMGGPISLQVAGDMPAVVRGIVCVDTLQNADLKPPREMFEQAALQMQANYSKALRSFMPMFFPKGADPTLVDWVSAQAAASNPAATIPLFRSLAEVDTAALMKNAKVPIRCINSKPYGPMATPTHIEVNQKYADFNAIEMAGTGHFPMLEKPAEFNAKFQQALDAITLAFTATDKVP